MCPEKVEHCSFVSFWCTNNGRVIDTVDDTCCCDIPETSDVIVNSTRDDVQLEEKTLKEVNVKFYVNIFCPKLVSACSKAVLTCPDIQDYYYNANDDYCCCIPDLKPILKIEKFNKHY